MMEEGLNVTRQSINPRSESPFMSNHIYSIYKNIILYEETDSVDPEQTTFFLP